MTHPVLRVGELVWSQHKADAILTLLSMPPKVRVGGDKYKKVPDLGADDFLAEWGWAGTFVAMV